MLKIDLTAIGDGGPMDVTTQAEIVTPMPEPVKVPKGLLKALGTPDKQWVYRLPDGGAYGVVMRWDPEGKRKQIRPVVWTGKDFVSSGFGKGRPLFNSDMLAAHPLAPVLIVEGEKAAEAAAAYVPDGWVVTTWQGGAKAWEESDWSSLADHSCVIWPDNDQPGITAAADIQTHLARLGIASSLVALGPAFPDGWDLADELPGKYTGGQITKLLTRELKRAGVPNVEPLPTQAPVPEEIDDPDVAARREYRALGYDKQMYFLMTQSNQQIDTFTGEALMSEKTCMKIHGDRTYWGEQQGLYGDKPRVDWIMSGVNIMDQCRQAGVYDPKRLRGRGVWVDRGFDGVDRIVLNAGSRLVINRPGMPLREVSPVRFKSKLIYERTRELILDADDYQTQATDDDGRMIRDLCAMVRWDSEIYGVLLAGWIATAVVCGGMPWRTHCWITGNQGSGKSTVVNLIAAACIGDLGLYPMGATTEAGIRQAVENDALPVIFDEGENDTQGKNNAEARRQAILQLMRQASSDGRGRIMKGTATHSAREFTMRSAFLISSIGVGLKEAADLTRTAVLTIKPLDAFNYVERKEMERQFQDFIGAAYAMPADMPQRLLARQMANLFTLRKNAETFKETIAEELANRRIGDQLGTLLAGYHSLYSTSLLDKAACINFLKKYNWEEFTSVKGVREDMALMHHMCGYMIRVQTTNGSTQERAIGELLVQMVHPGTTRDVSRDTAEETLARYGLRVKFEKGDITGILIGQTVPNLMRIMQTSDYAEGWGNVLMRNPYAKKEDKPLRFGGVISRALFIPRQEWPIEELNG